MLQELRALPQGPLQAHHHLLQDHHQLLALLLVSALTPHVTTTDA